MRARLILLLTILLPVFAFSQGKIFYDIEGKGTTEDNATYYRVVKGDTAKDYYPSGEIAAIGTPIKIDEKDDSKSKWRGRRTSYYRVGFIKAIDVYNKDGKRDSTSTQYYESGKIQQKMTCRNGIVVGKFYYDWDEYGKVQKAFTDHFDNGNAYDWPLNTNAKHSCKILKDTGLSMSTLVQNAPVAQAINLQMDLFQDYSIETNVAYVGGAPGAWHGIIWGFRDWDNYNFFEISSNGNYRVGQMQKGTINYSNENSSSSKINQGAYDYNQMKIVKEKNTTTYSINGFQVYSDTVLPLNGNYIGFMLDDNEPQQCVFRDITVKQNVDKYDVNTDGVNASYPGSPENDEFAGWRAYGSGFFIDPRGYIATNFHVIKDASEQASDVQVVVVVGGTRKFYRAEIVSTDKDNDLAVIKIKDTSFKPYSSLPYNIKTTSCDIGTDVFSLGYPELLKLGVEIKFADGKISAKTGQVGRLEWYQITVPIHHGNSGGPLFDYDGNVVGITNAGIMDLQNVNYAIKSTYLRNFLDAIPTRLNLPSDNSLASKPLTEKIKTLSDYVVLIKEH